MTIMLLLISMFVMGRSFIVCKAPVDPGLYIVKSEPLYPFNIDDPILRAFCWFESRYQEDAVNDYTGARGILQILPSMIAEVNRILKEYGLGEIKYVWHDAFNAEKSIAMWYIVQTYHNPDYDITKACIIWFGSGTQWDGMTWVGY